MKKSNLNDYLNLHVCLSNHLIVCLSVPVSENWLLFLLSYHKILLMEATRYAFWVNQRPLGSMKQGKDELDISKLNQVGPNQMRWAIKKRKKFCLQSYLHSTLDLVPALAALNECTH